MASRRPPRLSRAAYIGKNRYCVTIHAFPGSCPFFANDCVERVLLQLRHIGRLQHFALLAFCFMRDHLHLVVEAADTTSDFVKFVTLFKQCTGFEHRRETGRHLWQEGYFDRVLRRDEDTLEAVRYVLGNPVRAGLVRIAHEWPFSGSDMFDIRRFD